MWRQRGKSLNYKERIRHIDHINKNSFPRLQFPVKEEEDGYIGKKQFKHKFHDQVVLAPPTTSKMTRVDKLNVKDIEGAFPSLNIESINNRKKHKSSKSLKTLPNYQAIDSLELLVKQKEKTKLEPVQPVKLKTEASQQKPRNLELSILNSFKIYDFNPEIYKKVEVREKAVNPTYLSSLRLA